MDLPPLQRTVVCGIAIGVIVAAGLASSLETLLFGISRHDPAAMAAAAAILMIAASVASWLPAARAVRIDPLPAL